MIGSIFILGIISISLGYFIGYKFEGWLYKTQKNIEKRINFRKYHIHHDLCGLILIFMAFAFHPISLKIMIAGLGLGLFIHHISTEGLRLITKD